MSRPAAHDDAAIIMNADEPTAAEAPAPKCPKCEGDMWDNRASKRNPRAPDYKCKDASCDGIIWPPREAGATVAPAQPAGTPDDPPCPVCGGKMWDDRLTKRNPKAPDFKCRNKPKMQGGPGCAGIIWPPRDGAAPRRSATPSPAPRAAASSPPPPPFGEYRDFNGDDDDLPF